jgi:hypothetical protein
MARKNEQVYPSRILVIKSCRTSLYNQAVGRLKELYPGASISCLMLHKMQEETRNTHPVDHAFVLPSKHDTYTVRALSWTVRRELKQHRFDLAVVIYANAGGAGYENVRELARALPARQQAYVDGVLAFGFLPKPANRLRAVAERGRRSLSWCEDLAYGVCAVPILQWKVQKRTRGAYANSN